MTRRPDRPTFADIVADVKAHPAPPPTLPRGPGFTGDGRIVDPDGRVYDDGVEIDRERATELLHSGAVVVIDDCGCGGFCGVEWVTEPTDIRRREVPELPGRKRKQVSARMSEWTAADGTSLLLYEGPEFRWPRGPVG